MLEERPRNPAFLSGCRDLARGRPAAAKAKFRRALALDPLHADAMHHLAVVLDAGGRRREALELWERGMDLLRAALPEGFRIGRNALPWRLSGNRPFLRLVHGLGCALLERGRRSAAQKVLETLLELNPADEPGVRELLMEIYLDADSFVPALRLSERYPDERLPGMLYGRALALFRAGARREAGELLESSVKRLPRVAAELLREVHPRPRTDDPGMVTPGGWDEAYDHWLRFGRFWRNEAREWLGETVRRVGAQSEKPNNTSGL